MNELERNQQLKKKLELLVQQSEEKLRLENEELERQIKLLELKLGSQAPSPLPKVEASQKEIRLENSLTEIFTNLSLDEIMELGIGAAKHNNKIPLAVTGATQLFSSIAPFMLNGSISINDVRIRGDFEIKRIAEELKTSSIKSIIANSLGASRLQEIFTNIAFEMFAESGKSEHFKYQWLNQSSCDNKRYDFEFKDSEDSNAPNITLDCKSINVISNNLLVPKDKLQNPFRMADIYILHFISLSNDGQFVQFKCRGWQDKATLTWIVRNKEKLSSAADEMVFQFPEGLKIKPPLLRDFQD